MYELRKRTERPGGNVPALRGFYGEKAGYSQETAEYPGDHRVSLLALISYCTAFLSDSVYY